MAPVLTTLPVIAEGRVITRLLWTSLRTTNAPKSVQVPERTWRAWASVPNASLPKARTKTTPHSADAVNEIHSPNYPFQIAIDKPRTATSRRLIDFAMWISRSTNSRKWSLRQAMPEGASNLW